MNGDKNPPTSYLPPLDQLLTAGEKATVEDLYNRIKPGPEQVPDLIRMAQDEELNWADGNSLEVWAPLHAVRLLGKMQAAEAAAPLLPLLALDDDGMRDELPGIYGQLGGAAIPALEEYLGDPNHEEMARGMAALGLQEIAQAHRDERNRVVSILRQQLRQGSAREMTLNAMIIGCLMGLQAEEALPDMEQAFREDRVELIMSGDWNDVRRHFGLESTEEPFPSRQEAWESFWGQWGEAQPSRQPSPSTPEASSSREERRQRRRERRAKLRGKRRKR